MKIKFTKENLNKALSILQKASQNKVHSNIPGSVFLTVKDNQVEMQANDFEIGLQVIVDAEIIERGTVVLPSKYFQEMVRKMPDEYVTLTKEADQNIVTITSGSALYKLVTYNPEEFTLVEQIYKENTINMDTLALKELIDLTSYAVSTDEAATPLLNGLLIEIKGNTVGMVGTNSHRLAIKTVEIEDTAEYELKSVVPSRVLTELSRLLPVDEPQMLQIIWNKTQIAFVFDNVYMVARFLEGEFPRYENIFHQQFFANATLNRKELIGAVERVSLLSQGNTYNAIKFDWEFDKVTLTSQNIEVGSAKENIPCEFKGEPFSISFNGRYIMDILKHGSGDFAYFNLTERGPLIIRIEDNPNYTYVTTPIRTN